MRKIVFVEGVSVVLSRTCTGRDFRRINSRIQQYNYGFRKGQYYKL